MIGGPNRHTVVFVHGINDNGRWDDVIRYLEPFFDCVPVRYRGFHLRGEICLFCWLCAPLILLIPLTSAGRYIAVETLLTATAVPGLARLFAACDYGTK